MLPQNVEKEMHLCRAQYLRFFRVRQDRVGKQERPAEGAAPPPKGQREALDAAFSKSLRLLLDPERQLMQKLVNREALEKRFHQLDQLVDRDPGFKALGNIEREVGLICGGGMSAAALEGAGLGSLGVGNPEVILLSALMLRSLYEMALIYGVSVDRPWEKDLALMVLSAAFASGDDAYRDERDLSRALDSLADGQPITIDRDRRIRQAAGRMAQSMSLQKFIQGIPVVGISGMFFNTAAMTRLSSLSRCVYKYRYLAGKKRAYRHYKM